MSFTSGFVPLFKYLVVQFLYNFYRINYEDCPEKNTKYLQINIILSAVIQFSTENRRPAGGLGRPAGGSGWSVPLPQSSLLLQQILQLFQLNLRLRFFPIRETGNISDDTEYWALQSRKHLWTIKILIWYFFSRN